MIILFIPQTRPICKGEKNISPNIDIYALLIPFIPLIYYEDQAMRGRGDERGARGSKSRGIAMTACQALSLWDVAASWH